MKKIKASHKGRMCRFPRCRVVLSIYNHDCYCYLHQNRIETRAVYVKEKIKI